MSPLCHLSSELQAGHKSVTWRRKDEIAYICVGRIKPNVMHNRAKRPFKQMWPSHASARRPQTQHSVYHWRKKKKRGNDGVRERKKGWIQPEERQRQLAKRAQSVILPPLGARRREVGKKKGSLECTRGKFFFSFSWTAECLIMGLDLTSTPLGMWNRVLVVNGWKSLGDDVGRTPRRRGGPGCGAGCR